MARIAFLIPDLGGGGAERVALTLVGAFLERGHEVDVLVMRRRGELVGHLPAGARLIELRADRTRNVIYPLIRYLRERRPAALQVSLWPLTVIGIIAARLSRVRVRVVISDHISLSRQYGMSKLVLASIKLTTRWVYPLADARICVSRGSAKDLSLLSGMPADAITTVYNPIAVPRPSGDATKVASQWGAAKARLLSVGTLKSQKNQALLIRSVATIAERLDAKLLILGEGELRPELQRLIDRLGLANRAQLVGFVPDPSPYYATADLFVLSSDYEGFALVLVEALHAGLRIVSTDCRDGPAEILEDGRYGRLVPVGDSAALASAIDRELQEPRDPALQRRRARDFGVETAAAAYLEALLAGGDAGTATAAKRFPT